MSAVARSCITLLGVLALACPDVVRNQTAFNPSAPGEAPALTVSQDVQMRGVGGDYQTIPAGSRWRRVGTLEQGEVYKRTDSVFVLTSMNAHEGYLVVRSGAVVGFYLPGEGAFAPARNAVALPP